MPVTGAVGRVSDSLIWLHSTRSHEKGKATISNNTMTPPARPLEAYWLIVKSEAGRKEMLKVELDGWGGALAVFGFEEEAEMFSLGILGGKIASQRDHGQRVHPDALGALRWRRTRDPRPALPDNVFLGMVGLASIRASNAS